MCAYRFTLGVIVMGVTSLLSGCGEAQGALATPSASTGNTLSIAPTSVSLSGSYVSDPGTTTVFVNGARASMNNGHWSANVRSINSRYQTVRVELYVNNVLTNAHEVTVEKSAVQ